MPLEDLVGPNKYLEDLVKEWPLGIDPQAEGDDHIRGVKNVLLNTFGPLDAEVDWQLWAPRRKGATAGTYETGSLDLPYGSDINRPAVPVTGTMRLADTGFVEMWDGTQWLNKFAHPEKNNEFSASQLWSNPTAIIFQYEPSGQDFGSQISWYYGDPLTTWVTLKAGGDSLGAPGDAAFALDMTVNGALQSEHFRVSSSAIEIGGVKVLTEATRPFSQSAPLSYSNGGAITYPHGLGVRPVSYQAFAICDVEQYGYVPGQEIAIGSHASDFQQDTGNGNGYFRYYGLSIYLPDDENVAARIAPNGITVFSRTTSSFAVLSPANWSIRLRAWG